MEYVIPKRLIDRLRQCGELWAHANRSSLSRLGRLVVKDSSFFVSRTDAPKGVTTATLERFAEYLIQPANWPDQVAPDVVREFAHVVGITMHHASASIGQCEQMSGEAAK